MRSNCDMWEYKGVGLNNGWCCFALGDLSTTLEMTERYFKGAVLLRIRGFLHAFHLVEMTIPPKNIISSVVLSFRA